MSPQRRLARPPHVTELLSRGMGAGVSFAELYLYVFRAGLRRYFQERWWTERGFLGSGARRWDKEHGVLRGRRVEVGERFPRRWIRVRVMGHTNAPATK